MLVWRWGRIPNLAESGSANAVGQSGGESLGASLGKLAVLELLDLRYVIRARAAWGRSESMPVWDLEVRIIMRLR